MDNFLGYRFYCKAQPLEIHPLRTNKLVSLYFGANWCAPSEVFLPKLIEFYNEVNLEDKVLEIVYVSRDETREMYEAQSAKMPWLIIPWGDARHNNLVNQFEVLSIPKLIVLQKNGTVLTYDGKPDILANKEEAFELWLEKQNF